MNKEERGREKEGGWGKKRGGDGRGLRRERERESKVGNDAPCKVILT